MGGGGGGVGGAVLFFFGGFVGFFVLATAPKLGDSGRSGRDCSSRICADSPAEVEGCALLFLDRLLFLPLLVFCSVVLSVAL